MRAAWHRPDRAALSLSKRHPTERYRGGHQWVERWTTAKAGYVGFLTGRGYSADAIAERLNDGTKPGTVRERWADWGIEGERGVMIVIPVSIQERANLTSRAQQHGIPIEKYAKLLLLACSMPRDRFDEIVQ